MANAKHLAKAFNSSYFALPKIYKITIFRKIE